MSAAQGLLTTEVRSVDEWQVVSLRGDADASQKELLTQVLTDAAAVDGKGVVVDTSRVEFLDSAGTTALIRGQEAATGHGRDFRLVASTRPVLRLLEIAGLDALFPLHPTLEAALAGDRSLQR